MSRPVLVSRDVFLPERTHPLSSTWAAYRRARRRSRQAWVLVIRHHRGWTCRHRLVLHQRPVRQSARTRATDQRKLLSSIRLDETGGQPFIRYPPAAVGPGGASREGAGHPRPTTTGRLSARLGWTWTGTAAIPGTTSCGGTLRTRSSRQVPPARSRRGTTGTVHRAGHISAGVRNQHGGPDRPCRGSGRCLAEGRPGASLPKQRQNLANDPLNLIAADGPANVKKARATRDVATG